MKLCMVVVFAIGLLFINTTHAADDCEAEYLKLINGLENSTKILEADKEKYLPPLEKALQLCKEGKLEEADKIVNDLKNEALLEEVFGPLGK